jgi:hypothetical protein
MVGLLDEVLIMQLRSKPKSNTLQEVPLNIVGSTTFGRYAKISTEQTFNMLISDNWLVSYAGYKVQNVLGLYGNSGRGLYSSTRLGKLIAVIDNSIFVIESNFFAQLVGKIDTVSGDVFIDENNKKQIAICDKLNLWIYDYENNTFQKSVLPIDDYTGKEVVPGYVTYHDGYFLISSIGSPSWFLSPLTSATDNWNWGGGGGISGTPVTTTIQTKPDICQAVQRFPGRGNLILVFGSTVTELWTDVGGKLFPYQRNSAQSIDYGCLNPSTIAAMNNIVCWLAGNEKSGPTIMYTEGGDIQKISNDGIDFKLSTLKNPTQSYGFMFRQDGHLLYQLTFTDPKDNFSLVYDFNTQKFFTLTDENMNFHIAKKVSFFNETYFFVSTIDGNLYEFSTKYVSYDYGSKGIYEIPRIRVCKNFRLPDQSRFVVNNITFTIEQGDSELNFESKISLMSTNNDIILTTENNVALVLNETIPISAQRVDLTISKDGGVQFSNSVSKILNTFSNRANKFNYWQLGYANDFVPQFRFHGLSKFVCTDGLMSYYQ